MIYSERMRKAVRNHRLARAGRFDTGQICSAVPRPEDYLDAIPTSDGQIGAAYAIGETLLGIDVFDSDATFKKASPQAARELCARRHGGGGYFRLA
jgi:hypothetical protein